MKTAIANESDGTQQHHDSANASPFVRPFLASARLLRDQQVLCKLLVAFLAILPGTALAIQDSDEWVRWSNDQPSQASMDAFLLEMSKAGLRPSHRNSRIFLPVSQQELNPAHIPTNLLAFGLHLTNDNTSAEQLIALQGNPNLRSLTLVGFGDGQQCVQAASRQKELRLLSMMNCDVTDAHLQQLASLVHLETLLLKGTQVRGPGLKELSKLSTLETLEVDLSEEQFQELLGARLVHVLPIAHGPNRSTARNDTDVTELELNGFYGFPVSDSMLTGIHELESLQRLSLIESPVTDLAVPKLLQIRQLQYLNLERTKITDETLFGLSASQHLQVVILDETAVSSGGLKHLHSFPTLTELHLNRCQLDDTAIPTLALLPKLTKLEIGATSVRFEVDVGKNSFASLNHLNLNASQLTNRGLESIALLPSLTWLDLTLCKVGDGGIEKLARCKTLEVLYLNRTKISDSSLHHLSSLSNLRVLSLHSTEITDEGLPSLSTLSNLESLILQGTHVSEAAVKSLQPKLPRCSIVR